MTPVPIEGVVRGRGVGEVVASKDPNFEVGRMVQGMFGWQDFALAMSGDDQLSKIDLIPADVAPQHTIGAVGPPGFTAYIGMMDMGKMQAGKTVLVSGAAGATGSVAAQIARLKGASKVVGIAGGEAKCRWLLDEAKLDGAIDYKAENLLERLGEEFPNGVDLFFDNVGGEILETALLSMAPRGRVVLCGSISGYNQADVPPGPRSLTVAILKELTLKGFVHH
jgi:NADPH-dependent curcumin reductase CurA